jgi:hypothetical protein
MFFRLISVANKRIPTLGKSRVMYMHTFHIWKLVAICMNKTHDAE